MEAGNQVFIGSSTEQKGLAKKIQTEIEKIGLSVLPWWDKKAFKPGQFTMRRLIQMARICEASVFVFAGDDEVWFRKDVNPDPMLSARDNVMLEYGLFVGYGGPMRTLIVAENGVKLPSDLNGMTVIFYDRKKESLISVARSVREHFEDLMNSRESKAGFRDSNFVLRTNWDIEIHKLKSDNPSRWSNPRLYEGRTAAALWNAVATDEDYSRRTQTDISGKQIANLIGKRAVHTVVSFGPGTGFADSEIIGSLASDEVREYVPIDLNTYFLAQSANRVSSKNSGVECKNAILCNFDDDITLIESLVASFCPSPRLFLMHGGTFSNLRTSEKAMLNAFYRMMEPGDIFVFDLFCKTDSYSPNIDPFAKISEIQDPIQRLLVNGLRQVLTNPLNADPSREEISYEEALTRLKSREVQDVSAFDNSTTIQIYDEVSKKIILQINRFDNSEVKSEIKFAGFSIFESKCVDKGLLERHVLLAEK